MEGPPDLGPDFNFDKCKFALPTSLNAPLMSARTVVSSIKKTDKDGKKSKKDKKDKEKETPVSKTPIRGSKDISIDSNAAKLGRRESVIQSPLLRAGDSSDLK